jgi:hypothetical protein
MCLGGIRGFEMIEKKIIIELSVLYSRIDAMNEMLDFMSNNDDHISRIWFQVDNDVRAPLKGNNVPREIMFDLITDYIVSLERKILILNKEIEEQLRLT